LFIITFVAAPRAQPGCSCSSPPPVADDAAAAKPAPSPRHQARRDSPPLIAPGDAPPEVKPTVLKDEQSGTLFYFESDGQHVTAIDKNGNVLWHRNPVKEGGIKGLSREGKTVWPTIVFAGPPVDWMLKVMKDRGKKGECFAVGFNTKDFGVLDKQTGEYTSMGRD
jgi:hypothetical protein